MITALMVILFIILFIAVLVLMEFIESKNGELRKIMIGYFMCEVWKNCIGIVLLMFYEDDIPPIVAKWILAMVLPKAVIKIWLYKYLLKNKK